MLFNRKSAFKSQCKGKGQDRMRARLALQNDKHQDELPKIASMKSNLKHYEDHERGIPSLNPLREFLDARVGQPISIVEADFHKRLNKRYPDRIDLFRIYEELLVQHVELESDGIYHRHYGKYMRIKLVKDFYVHPQTLTVEKVLS